MYPRTPAPVADVTTPDRPAPRRAGLRAAAGLSALAVIATAALSGCSATVVAKTGGTGGPSTAATVSSPPAAASTSTQPAAPPSTTPAQGVSAPPAAPVTLGQLAGVFAHGSGFGQIEPAKIFNGGDPTGLVTHIAWRSWGSARAVGTGTSEYVGPSQSVATGTEEPVTVVAFRLGTCDGKRMYRAVEWYFPQHGQAFDPGRYEDICTGSYVPSS
jgi:hypothetical protein